VTEQGPPEPVDPRADRLRWLARGAALVIGLWFIADGLSGVWPGAGTVARIMIGVGVVLGTLYLARRGREG
jgi:hypothetical protein